MAEQIVWKVTRLDGSHCFFGHHGLAIASARGTGTVEEVRITHAVLSVVGREGATPVDGREADLAAQRRLNATPVRAVAVEGTVIRNTEEMMGEVIQLPKRNVQHASTEQLKHEWDLWADCNEEELDGVEFHYEQIHAELNRRGEGKHCAV